MLLSCARSDITPELTILGCTLWSAIDPENLSFISIGLNDFYRIGDLDLETYGLLHTDELTWLSKETDAIKVKEPHRRIAFFTHHAPTLIDIADPRYHDGPSSLAFATELTGKSYWVHL